MRLNKNYKRTALTSAITLVIAGTMPAQAGLLGGLLGGDGSSAGDGSPSETSGNVGFFSNPFAEPTIQVDGAQVATSDRCIVDASGSLQCKPTAGTIAVLGDGRFLYLNALEGTENAELAVIAQFGEVSVNDQSRVMTLDGNDQASWVKPSPIDGGANPDGNDSTTLTGGLLDTANNTDINDGALFCADVVFLPDGRMMAVGGTDYYSEPGIDGLPVGVVELEGLKASRIFDPATNTWSQSGDMEFGRWYRASSAWPTTTSLSPAELPSCSSRFILKTRFSLAATWHRPKLTTSKTAPGPTTVQRRSARFHFSHGCTCCLTAMFITTPAARPLIHSARPTIRHFGTSSEPIIPKPNGGRIWLCRPATSR